MYKPEASSLTTVNSNAPRRGFSGLNAALKSPNSRRRARVSSAALRLNTCHELLAEKTDSNINMMHAYISDLLLAERKKSAVFPLVLNFTFCSLTEFCGTFKHIR